MDGSYATKGLTQRTWPDFVRLFSQGGGWDFCACMLFQRGCQPIGKQYRGRAATHAKNLADKEDLVRDGQAHGILVYADDEPVGWCEYGPIAELPLPGAKRLESKVERASPISEWRIPCFVTHKNYRRRGVAGVALAAAVEAIGRQGGGWVEATPIVGSHPAGRYHQIVRAHGRDSDQMQEFLANWPYHDVPGVGPVPLTRGGFGGVSHPGTVSMFLRQDFEPVKIIRDTCVLMQRHVSNRTRGGVLEPSWCQS